MMSQKTLFIFLLCGCTLLLGTGEVTAQQDTLTLWSHWGREPVKVTFMNAMAEAFQKEYAIALTIVWMPKNELKDKLPFALDTSGPDITYIDTSFTHQRIWRSLADLSELQFPGPLVQGWQIGSFQEYKNTFLPIEGVSSAMYYNTELFEKAGIVLPDDRKMTTQEFLAIIGKLRAAGITPIGEGTADRGTKAGFPILEAIFRYAGPDKFHGLFTGEIDFSDPDIIEALKFWKQVIDAKGYDTQRILELGLTESIFEVTDGKAAIYFCGTYFYSKYGATEHDRGQIGVLDWFISDTGKGNQSYELFWAAGFGLNKYSQRLDKAKLFLEFLMSPLAASLWVEHVQAPYPVITEKPPDTSLYSELLRQRQTQAPYPAPIIHRSFPKKASQQMWEDATLRFLLGEHSVEQFVERMNSRL